LNNPADKQHIVIVCAAPDNCPNDTHHTGEEENRSFAILVARCTYKGTSKSDYEKLIASKLSDRRNTDVQLDRNGDYPGCEQWTLPC
jgi:hypothetical protein